jgi:hypothetical protein
MTSLENILVNFASKADLNAATALLEAHFKADIAGLKAEISALDARLAKSMNRQAWAITGAVLALGAAHFFHL